MKSCYLVDLTNLCYEVCHVFVKPNHQPVQSNLSRPCFPISLAIPMSSMQLWMGLRIPSLRLYGLTGIMNIMSGNEHQSLIFLPFTPYLFLPFHMLLLLSLFFLSISIPLLHNFFFFYFWLFLHHCQNTFYALSYMVIWS